MGFIYKNLKYMGLQPNIGTFSTKRKIDLFATGTLILQWGNTSTDPVEVWA